MNELVGLETARREKSVVANGTAVLGELGQNHLRINRLRLHLSVCKTDRVVNW
jgi:hypothetical protein